MFGASISFSFFVPTISKVFAAVLYARAGAEMLPLWGVCEQKSLEDQLLERRVKHRFRAQS